MKYVTTAFIFYKGKLLVVFHKKLNRWLHVGGHLETDEDFEESLLREIKEETGLSVELLNLDDKKLFDYFRKQNKEAGIKPLNKPFFIHVKTSKNDRSTLLDYICIARSDKVKLQKEELSEYKWITKKDINTLETSDRWKKLALKAFDIYSKR